MEVKQRYRAPALEKGLDILETLAGTSAPLSQNELAQKLNRSPNEIFRMLTCLEERGYVKRQSPYGPYRLTLRLYELGHKQNAVSLLRNAARLPLERIAEECGQACHLSVQSESLLLVLMERMPSRRVCLAVGEGATFPLIETTSGKLLLSRIPAAEVESFLARDHSFQAKSGKEQKAFMQTLNKMREADFVVSASGVTEGVHDAAVMVGARGTDTIGVLSMPFLRSGSSLKAQGDSYVKAIRACAMDINTHLGLLG